jgi:protease-4
VAQDSNAPALVCGFSGEIMAMSRGRKIALWICGILLAGLIVVGALALTLYLAIRGGQPTVKDNSVLVLRVEGALPDYVPDDPTRKLLGRSTQSLNGLLWQIKKAKVDKRVSALLLEVGMTESGWAKLDEIRDAVTDFRASGKPVYAYIEFGTSREYYVANVCDKIFMPTSGDLYVHGLAGEAMFFRGSLDKLGVEPDVFKIGKYKNAPDSYTLKEMSEGQREVTNAILDDYFGRLVESIAQTRKKTPEEVKAIIDGAPYSAVEAKDKGLIDGLAYRDELKTELKKRLGYKETEELNIIGGGEYKQIAPESLDLNEGPQVAVIYGSGAIGGGKSGDDSIGADTMVANINDAAKDDGIKAIVLRVNSPGGSAYASDVIWHAVENAKKKKPVVVSMGDYAASGGYYISCNANKIVAQPTTLTGSIGIFAGKPVIKGLYNWLGVSNEYTMRGKNAGLFRETEKFSPDERARFEAIISQTYYGEFVPRVANGRGKDEKYIDSIGQGRVWTGRQAKENGLVDEIGGLETAINEAKKLAKLPMEKDVRRVIFPEPRPFIEEYLGLGDDDARIQEERQRRAMLNALPEAMRRPLKYAQVMEQMQRGEVMLLTPFELTIK